MTKHVLALLTALLLVLGLGPNAGARPHYPGPYGHHGHWGRGYYRPVPRPYGYRPFVRPYPYVYPRPYGYGYPYPVVPPVVVPPPLPGVGIGGPGWNFSLGL